MHSWQRSAVWTHRTHKARTMRRPRDVHAIVQIHARCPPHHPPLHCALVLRDAHIIAGMTALIGMHAWGYGEQR